jgi:hypothetical protein
MLSGKQWAGDMPQYTIELIDRPTGKPGGRGITNRQTCQFASEADALRRAAAFYKEHEGTVVGWRVLDAAGKIVEQRRL